MNTYPLKIPPAVPMGQVIAHNQVHPARRQGTRGFRFWLQRPATTLTLCDCGWAAKLPEHYRVRRRTVARP
jgi:hypothetical protein